MAIKNKKARSFAGFLMSETAQFMRSHTHDQNR